MGRGAGRGAAGDGIKRALSAGPSHQDLLRHLLDLLGFGLDVVLQLVLPALHHLQPLHLVLQGLPALLRLYVTRRIRTRTHTQTILQDSSNLLQWYFLVIGVRMILRNK